MEKFLSNLPVRYRWTIHNLVGHPVAEVLGLLGLQRLADVVHDGTVPPAG